MTCETILPDFSKACASDSNCALAARRIDSGTAIEPNRGHLLKSRQTAFSLLGALHELNYPPLHLGNREFVARLLFSEA